MDESIIVVRSSETEIKAFHNVCPHRGRQLTEGCGRAKLFKCRFHGWEFNLDGTNKLVIDRKDFGNYFSDEDISLKPVQVDTRSEEHTSELQSLMRISYAVFCWKKK